MLSYARRYSILLAPTTIAAAEAAGLSRLEMLWRVADRVSLPAAKLLSCDTGDDEIEVEVGVSPVDVPTLEIAGKPAGALPPPLAALVVAAIRASLGQSDAAPRGVGLHVGSGGEGLGQVAAPRGRGGRRGC